jgi:hypothetical protein
VPHGTGRSGCSRSPRIYLRWGVIALWCYDASIAHCPVGRDLSLFLWLIGSGCRRRALNRLHDMSRRALLRLLDCSEQARLGISANLLVSHRFSLSAQFGHLSKSSTLISSFVAHYIFYVSVEELPRSMTIWGDCARVTALAFSLIPHHYIWCVRRIQATTGSVLGLPL